MLYPHPQKFDHLRCFFAHSPKCAGTSIERTLAAPGQTVGGHSTAQAMAQKWPQEWAEYFTFAVARDPSTRFLSAFSYLREHPIHPHLHNSVVHDCAHVEALCARLEDDPAIMGRIVHLWPQNRFICDSNGVIMVDKIYPFESLEDGWWDICSRLGIQSPLPKLNPSPKVEASAKVGKVVRKFYAKDYELLGYG